MSDKLKNNEKHVEVIDDYWKSFDSQYDAETSPVLVKQNSVESKIFSKRLGFDLLLSIIASKSGSINVDGNYVSKPKFPAYQNKEIFFDDFIDDLLHLNGGKTITLTKDYCLSYSQEFQDIVRHFSHNYFKRFGIPSSAVNAVFITGKYKETWIGLHNDYCESFLIPVIGKKKMLIWEPSYFDNAMKKQGSNAMNGYCIGQCDIKSFIGDAIVFDVFPGDVLYIPKNWWHYNLLEEAEKTITISLGFFDKKNSCYQSGIHNKDKLIIPPPSPGIIPKKGANCFWSAPNIESWGHDRIIEMLLKSSCSGVVASKSNTIMNSEKFIDKTYTTKSDCPIYILPMSEGAGVLIAMGDIMLISQFKNASLFVEFLILEKKIRWKDIKNFESLEIEEIFTWLVRMNAMKPC